MNNISSIKSAIKKSLSGRAYKELSSVYRSAIRPINPILAFFAKISNVGAGTYIDRTAHVLGWRNIRIGKSCVISSDCWLNVNSRSGNSPTIEIGDFSFVGRRNFFSSGKKIYVGPYALTGPDCKFMGSDHLFNDPLKPFISTGTTDLSTIYVGANCWLGADVRILGNVTIGHGCVLGAGATVLSNVPPFSVVVGSPARVLKRYDIEAKTWVRAEDFSAAQEAALPDEQTYLSMLRANTPFIHMPTVAAGKSRGDLP